MVDVLRFHEISESTHWIMNPMPRAKVELLGEICHLRPTDAVLDLACGKGALLTLLSQRYGARGIGVDIHPPFLQEARRRADAYGVADRLQFLEADAGDRGCTTGRFELVSCLGATWIGGGLSGTLRLMCEWLAPGGWLLVGEAYWADEPSGESRRRHVGGEGFSDLVGILEQFDALELDLVEMVLSSPDDWDRYAASQWLNVSNWLASHADDPDAGAIRQQRDEARRGYLFEDRRSLGWGVFVLRELRPRPITADG
jgi:SAM-dependent methyltransferase